DAARADYAGHVEWCVDGEGGGGHGGAGEPPFDAASADEEIGHGTGRPATQPDAERERGEHVCDDDGPVDPDHPLSPWQLAAEDVAQGWRKPCAPRPQASDAQSFLDLRQLLV